MQANETHQSFLVKQLYFLPSKRPEIKGRCAVGHDDYASRSGQARTAFKVVTNHLAPKRSLLGSTISK